MEKKRERKRITRKELSKTNRHDRLLANYVKFKYPDVYEDAEACYQQLNAKYPDKRDLSKTLEYVQLTTGATSYTQYYNYRKLEKKTQEKSKTASKTTTTTGKHVNTDNTDSMVLQIPLLSPETVASNVSLDIPEYNEVMTEIMQDPNLRAIFNNLTTTPDGETSDTSAPTDGETSDTSAPETNTSADTSPPESLEQVVQNIPHQTPPQGQSFQDLVDDLVSDPQLDQVFNDMDDDMQSPLERELTDILW